MAQANFGHEYRQKICVIKKTRQNGMAEHISKLKLVWRIRKRNDDETRRDYLDFVVDGKSLRDTFNEKELIGCFGWLSSKDENVFLDELLLEKLPNVEHGRGNRVLLYICSECGDIDCGAITVQIEKTKSGIVWKNFSRLYYQTDLPDNPPYKHDLKIFEKVGPYCFEESEYQRGLISRPFTRWKKDD